jgi:hypothetical protein
MVKSKEAVKPERREPGPKNKRSVIPESFQISRQPLPMRQILDEAEGRKPSVTQENYPPTTHHPPPSRLLLNGILHGWQTLLRVMLCPPVYLEVKAKNSMMRSTNVHAQPSNHDERSELPMTI